MGLVGGYILKTSVIVDRTRNGSELLIGTRSWSYDYSHEIMCVYLWLAHIGRHENNNPNVENWILLTTYRGTCFALYGTRTTFDPSSKILLLIFIKYESIASCYSPIQIDLRISFILHTAPLSLEPWPAAVQEVTFSLVTVTAVHAIYSLHRT